MMREWGWIRTQLRIQPSSFPYQDFVPKKIKKERRGKNKVKKIVANNVWRERRELMIGSVYLGNETNETNFVFDDDGEATPKNDSFLSHMFATLLTSSSFSHLSLSLFYRHPRIRRVVSHPLVIIISIIIAFLSFSPLKIISLSLNLTSYSCI